MGRRRGRALALGLAALGAGALAPLSPQTPTPPRGGGFVITPRVVTLAPGEDTGWHHHPGPLIALVASGTLTRTLDDCSVEVSTRGDTVVEPPGAAHVHIGRNLGTEPVVLYATYLTQEGSPLAVPADDPGCGS
ncbi:cupin domain-containing protein [Streptomyces radicis]|uniref:Cupin domain-containing protein n=1 Tax=Streptomyces radicis TaxID=1750517 RepID=A0A3A9WI22_9ACTN|nr:cupin domain-containing protein [Streptomyces radicis]RKN12615.1 cupin domain-containing protein [Streptomyces radicis]RKN27621.1 cupin domain-containing protein [Streptomyces radicis]